MTPEEEIRALFHGHTFGAPCGDNDIRRAEAILGEPLPTVIRNLYLAFDGFLGSTDAAFFWPLFADRGLVRMNQFYRSSEIFPHELVVRCLFFGDNGCGTQWGFKSDLPGQIIQWNASWGNDFELAGHHPLDAWRAEKQLYEDAE
jgi:hypothetical protein